MKRSAQVALLVMGVGGVGAGAYALTPPRNNCVAPGGTPPSAMAPNRPGVPAADPCPPRRQGSGIGAGRSYGFWSGSGTSGNSSSRSWSAPIFGGGNATSTVPAAGRSGGVGTSTGGGVARGGFGATGHAASAGG